MKLKRSALISQGSLNRLLRDVAIAWNNKNFKEAIELMERASHLDPANISLTLDLGRCYGLRYDVNSAIRCFEKAARMASNKAKVLSIAGLNCRDFGDFELAESYYLKALEQNSLAPETFVELAKLYERTRCLDKANEMLDRAIRANSQCTEARLVRARLEREAGRIERAEEIIRSVIGKPSQDTWTHAQCWYELGAILDRQEKYDEAINAFVQAKALVHPHSTRFIVELKIVRDRIRTMQASVNSHCIQEWLNTGKNLAPLRRVALLGGHPRSGTTLLEQVLDSHADITSIEETTIFHDDAYIPLANRMPDATPIMEFLQKASLEALNISRVNYFHSAELFLKESLGERLLVDKNPSLTFLLPAMLRIFPEVRLLIALRDPRDVILSCFMQPLRPEAGNVAYQRIQTTVEDYATMMNLWLTLKPVIEGHFLEVKYEDMVNHLELTTRKSLEFLGVAWDKKVLNFDKYAKQKVVRSPTYSDVTKPVYNRAVGRWRNYQKFLEPHLKTIEPFVKLFGYE